MDIKAFQEKISARRNSFASEDDLMRYLNLLQEHGNAVSYVELEE